MTGLMFATEPTEQVSPRSIGQWQAIPSTSVRSDLYPRVESSRGTDTLSNPDTFTVTSDALVSAPQPKKAFAAQILTPQPSPSPVQSPTTGAVLPSPRSGYTGLPRFPLLPSPRAPPGTVMPAPPLDIMHFECYQSHMHMRSSRYVCMFQPCLGRSEASTIVSRHGRQTLEF
jgi:hypothetical protein